MLTTQSVPDSASESSWPTMKRLLGYVKDRKAGLILAIIGMAGYAAVDTTFVYSIRNNFV